MGRFHRLLVGHPQQDGVLTIQPVAELRGRYRGKQGEGGIAFLRVSPVALFVSREGQERVAIPLDGAGRNEKHRLAVCIFLAVGLIGALIPFVVAARARKGG
jgi:hypothetical protein